jgi:plasmid maintenance system killer protein
MNVFEEEGVVEYLRARKIDQQYLKAKMYLEMGYFGQVDLRKRKPKTEGIYYFKITKKYRALGYFENKQTFIVVEISDHQ